MLSIDDPDAGRLEGANPSAFFALFLLSHNFFLSLSRRGLPPKTLKSGVVGVMLAALLKLIVGAGE